jgi:hypothetical protein
MNMTSILRSLRQIGLILVILVGLLVAAALVDGIPESAVRPPENLKTIEEFRVWKQGFIKGEGTYQNSGVTYKVLLGPRGRYLASGPSAYVFDEQGQFVDWTSDMGDFDTVKHHFDLRSGHVVHVRHNKP